MMNEVKLLNIDETASLSKIYIFSPCECSLLFLYFNQTTEGLPWIYANEVIPGISTAATRGQTNSATVNRELACLNHMFSIVVTADSDLGTAYRHAVAGNTGFGVAVCGCEISKDHRDQYQVGISVSPLKTTMRQ